MITPGPNVRRKLVVLSASAVAAVIVFLAGIWLGGHPSYLPGPLRGGFFENRSSVLVDQAVHLVSTRYYRPLARSNLVDRALSGMVASLDDPYSRYLNPQAYRERSQPPRQDVGGIGINTVPDPQGLRVRTVVEHSPAAEAGLMSADLIVKVGSTPVVDRPEVGSALIQGPVGTPVELTFMRGDVQHVISVKRAKVVVPVATLRMLTRHIRIAHLTLTGFTEDAGDRVRAELRAGLDAGAQAVILDLRGNGGGLIREAIDVASAFIPDGEIMAAEERGKPRRVYMARGNAIAPHIPMVVLVDHGTASAAEILTAALQDRGRAQVVGVETYGKGVFQVTTRLVNGGALDLSVGKYFSPSGHNLGGGGARPGPGITPNVEAMDDPRTPPDEALAVAARTVTAGH